MRVPLAVLVCGTLLSTVALAGLIVLSALGADTSALRDVLQTAANLIGAAAGLGTLDAIRRAHPVEALQE